MKLAGMGLAYRCFCSETQLNLDHKLAASRGLPPRYAGHCRHISASESEQRAATEPFIWRLRVHGAEGCVTVSDALRGDVHFELRDLDDPVVVRSDGSFTFLLPNAVDDMLDDITHVLRGDDHLTNSAYQVWLLERLEYQPPVYLHHGLLLGQNGTKLSKRSGSYSVAELRHDGLLPGALIQAMARLGHPNMPEDEHTIAALALHFEAEHVSTGSVHWSDDEMWRWHTRLLHKLDAHALVPMIQPYVPVVPPERMAAFAALIGKNLQRAGDAALYRRLLDVNAPLDSDALTIVKEAGPGFYQVALEMWNMLSGTDWKRWADMVKDASGRKGRALFMPLRVALSGALHGPEMSGIVVFLGRGGVVSGIEDARRQADT